MTSVAITGVSGYLGRLLVRHLEGERVASRIVGIDLVEPRYGASGFEFYRMDVRDPELGRVLQGCEALVHLAGRSRDGDEVRDANVGGVRAVLDAARAAGVRALVFTSPATVYGAHADNDFPLTEASPLRPNPGDVYATTMAEAEEIVRFFAGEHPETRVAVLRLAWVCGPTIPSSHAGPFDATVRFAVAGYDPPLQALHEDDAAAALAFALTSEIRGTFNVAAPDTVVHVEKLLGQRRVALEWDRARRVLERASRVELSPPPWALPSMMYPLVVSAEALAAAGFRPRHTTEQALCQAARARRAWASVAGLRFRPRRLGLLVAGLGAAAASAALRRTRHRRRRRGRRERGEAVR